MNDNEKILRDMWSKTENVMGGADYNRASIEQFISGRSSDTTQKITNMIIFDIVLKALVLALLVIDFALFYGTQNVMVVIATGGLLIIPLIFYQVKLLGRFTKAADNGQSTRDKLASMLTYLKTRFFSTLLSVSITYLFGFLAGSLVYFYVAYGKVRPLDLQDVVVFMIFILFGIILNFVVNKAQVKYHIKHLELCLSDLNDSVLSIISENIKTQQKQDRTNKILLAIVFIIGFLLLIMIFKNTGFFIR